MKFKTFGVSTGLCWLTCLLMASALYRVFFYAPPEKAIGVVQRILYFHVAAAATAFVSFFIVLIASIVYLAANQRRWDILAHASAEVGTLFCALALLTGLLWTKAAWHVWWPGEPWRTTMLVLGLMYGGYLLLRKYLRGARSAKFAAALGIVAFMDAPLVYWALRWQRLRHPAAGFGTNVGSWLTSDMLSTLLVSLAAFLCLYLYLLQQRVALARMEEELEAIRRTILNHQTKPALLIENENFIIEEYTLKEQPKS